MASPAECGIWALKKSKSLALAGEPFKDSTNVFPKTLKTVKPSFSQPTTSGFVPKKTNHLLKSLPKLGTALESPKGISYDGFGGHSKADEFPVPKTHKINSGLVKSKKPRGVSRPAAVPHKNVMSSQGSIDSFFTSM